MTEQYDKELVALRGENIDLKYELSHMRKSLADVNTENAGMLLAWPDGHLEALAIIMKLEVEVLRANRARALEIFHDLSL